MFVSADTVSYMNTLFERKLYVSGYQTKDDSSKLNKDPVDEFASFVK